MPEKSVPTDELVVLLSKVDEGIGISPVVGVLAWVDRLPLHRVLWSNLAGFSADDVDDLGLGEGVGVGGETEVLQAIANGNSVETSASRLRTSSSSGRGGGDTWSGGSWGGSDDWGGSSPAGGSGSAAGSGGGSGRGGWLSGTGNALSVVWVCNGRDISKPPM